METLKFITEGIKINETFYWETYARDEWLGFIMSCELYKGHEGIHLCVLQWEQEVKYEVQQPSYEGMPQICWWGMPNVETKVIFAIEKCSWKQIG
jgi:hypothetical protein